MNDAKDLIKTVISAFHLILAALKRHIPRVIRCPGLTIRISRDPRDLLSVMDSSIGYPAEIAIIRIMLFLLFSFLLTTYSLLLATPNLDCCKDNSLNIQQEEDVLKFDHAFLKDRLWNKTKRNVLSDLSHLTGCSTYKKGKKIMEFVRTLQPSICVEIGAFRGAVTYPIASALHYLQKGTLYAIDSWDEDVALEGLEDQKTREIWKNYNMEKIYQNFLNLLSQKQLYRCQPIRRRSQDAVSLFADGTIDMLFIDGSFSETTTLSDVVFYLPKVREDGYVWLNQPITKRLANNYLMNHCRLIKEESLGFECILFQKTASSSSIPSLKERSFVEGEIKGELGDNMFVVAAVSSYAWDMNIDPYFPELTHMYEDCKEDPHLNPGHIFSRCNEGGGPRAVASTWEQPTCAYHKIPDGVDIKIQGSFQSEKYFFHHRERILDLFFPRGEDVTYIKMNYTWLLNHPCSVGIEVRDHRKKDSTGATYIQYGKEYLNLAMSKFPKEALFIVSSDNIEFAKENIPETMVERVVYLENEPDYMNLFLISSCKHNIITNSTFGWWCAWLNKNQEKIIFAPIPWYNPKRLDLSTKDLFPESWNLLFFADK